jgi:hypothetical protein
MTTSQVASLGALGIGSCLALILVAAQLAVRWHRVVILCVSLQALCLQGVFWGGVLRTLRSFDVGGSYFLLYAALTASVTGMVWALVLLGSTLFGRRPTD